MSTVFADAGYWIALLNPRDRLHSAALVIAADPSLDLIVTTQMVLTEALNLVGSIGPDHRQRATDLASALAQSPGVAVVPQTPAQFEAALELYGSRIDQSWSLTDCASFLVMEERGITHALAFDRDFEQAGYTALLRDVDPTAG
ncbi:MAG: type II toxin-antitoxin system VapC family toxin [Chloroflexi bacterium]|nr:type II toxin-antitoxin system VapC family toxin [Chloroflexota bacterium]MYE32009.1 type II toxin-antitoxin system VapC family toxin [Chloroflexota bacterium]